LLFVTPFCCPIETVEASYAATLDLYLQNIEIRDWNDENDDAFLFSRERLQVLAASMLPVV
jgi:hypothetical protein